MGSVLIREDLFNRSGLKIEHLTTQLPSSTAIFATTSGLIALRSCLLGLKSFFPVLTFLKFLLITLF